MRKIRRFDSVIRHRMHQAFDGGILGYIVQDDSALGAIRGGNGFARRIVLVIGVGVLVVEDSVSSVEELPGSIDPRVENHGSDIRGDGLGGVGGGVVYIC